jgi:hypothetical protein
VGKAVSWQRVFDDTTPWATVEVLIGWWVIEQLAEVSEQIAAMDDLTPAEQQRVLEWLEPLIRARTADAFASGWLRLQRERKDGGGVHVA